MAQVGRETEAPRATEASIGLGVGGDSGGFGDYRGGKGGGHWVMWVGFNSINKCAGEGDPGRTGRLADWQLYPKPQLHLPRLT